MKKVLLSVVLTAIAIFGTQEANGQSEEASRIRFGIRANGSDTYLSASHSLASYASIGRPTRYKDMASPRVGGGLSLDITIGGYWGIETGAYYQMRGVEFDTDLKRGDWLKSDFTSFTTELKLRLHYIQVPIFVRFRHGIGVRPIEWEAKVGGYAAYIAGGRLSVDTKEWQAEDCCAEPEWDDVTIEHHSYDAFDEGKMSDVWSTLLKQDIEYASRRVDGGVIVGGGVTFWRHLYVGILLEQGIVGIVNTKNFLGNEDHKLRNQSLSLSVGYNF